MNLRVSLKFAPDRIRTMGTLSAIGRDTAFRFDADFLSAGLDPAPFRLPVKAGVAVYDHAGGMETFGLFEDSLPDGWGRRLVDGYFRKTCGRLPTVLERLSCVGANGMGALTYEPMTDIDGQGDGLDLARVADAAMDFDAGLSEDVLPEVRRAGGSSGGARPKAWVGLNPVTGEICADRESLPAGFEHWLVKFNTRAEGDGAGEMEYRYYEMAVAAGAEMSPCRLLETKAGRFFATKRFDRGPNGERWHFASAAGLLHADFRTSGDEYALLFKLTDALTRDYSAKRELFLRACLNVLAHNRDDHLKNFGFLMDARGRWRLSPFYDFTYSQGPNGWQTMSVSGEGADPGEKDLLRLAGEVGLLGADAKEILGQVKSAVMCCGEGR